MQDVIREMDLQRLFNDRLVISVSSYRSHSEHARDSTRRAISQRRDPRSIAGLAARSGLHARYREHAARAEGRIMEHARGIPRRAASETRMSGTRASRPLDSSRAIRAGSRD